MTKKSAPWHQGLAIRGQNQQPPRPKPQTDEAQRKKLILQPGGVELLWLASILQPHLSLFDNAKEPINYRLRNTEKLL